VFPGACIIKLIKAVINYIIKKASLFVEANKKGLPIAKALAYCTMLVSTAVKSLSYRLTGLYYKHVMIVNDDSSIVSKRKVQAY